MASTEQSFRASLSQFRWAQSNPSAAQQPSAEPAPSAFSRFTSSISGYVPLRSSERTNEEEAYFALSRWERFLGFLACLAGGAVCFVFAFFLFLPMLALRPHKFALAFSLGSLLVMSSFAVLAGPLNHLKHLASAERLPFSLAYFGSLALTIYFAVGAKSYIGSLVAGIVQVVALLSYIFAYFPGGITTLQFGGRMALRGAGSLLPI